LGYLPIYEKENAFNYLDEYDKIAIVDSDIFIRDSAPNIFDEIDMDTAFAGVYEKDMPLTPQYIKKIQAYSRGQYASLTDAPFEHGSFGTAFYNMGLMVFTKKLLEYLNGETPLEFIRRKEFERFVNGEGNWKWSTDQTLLNYWVHKSRMPKKNLDWKWNALFKGIVDTKLPESHFIHFFLSGNLPKKGAEIPSIVSNLDKASGIRGHG
jgi:lipopolysaccharide biosynthesis glycosyltransferase